MITNDEATARVARGSAWLDNEIPGWWHRVTFATLDMQSTCACVLAQVSGNYFNAIDDLTPNQDYEHASIAHGFDLHRKHDGNLDDSFEVLRAAWVVAIQARRAVARWSATPIVEETTQPDLVRQETDGD